MTDIPIRSMTEDEVREFYEILEMQIYVMMPHQNRSSKVKREYFTRRETLVAVKSFLQSILARTGDK